MAIKTSFSRAPFAPHRSSSAFTLIEILVVVGIVLIMMGAAVPAFQNLGRATALGSAGNTVANLAAGARQNSTSKSVLTALVVLTGTNTEADFRTVGLFECGVSGYWAQVGKWETLPIGIAIDPQDRVNCSFLDNSPTVPRLLDPQGQSSIRYLNQPVLAQNFACRIFVPTGSLSNPDQPAQLRLVEGSVESNQTIRYGRRNQDGTAANFFDLAIIGTTGATKITRP